MSDTDDVTRQLRIIGRVQGVGYRWSMAREAQRLRLSGWVRNRLDGSVEALVSGAHETVQALIDWAKGGPALARVDSVMVTEPNEERVAAGFEVRET